MKVVFGRRELALACLGLVAAAGLNVMVVNPAGATIIDTFAITSDHCSGGCLPTGVTSAGTVTVIDNGTGTLQYNVVMNPGFGIINTGGSGGLGASFGFNEAPSGGSAISPITETTLSSDGFAFSLESTSAGTIHVDGFGEFEYGLNCDSCGNGATNPDFGNSAGLALSFDVTAAGLSLADVTQSTGGAPDAFFAVDVYSTGTGKTGPMDASLLSSLTTTVPEPASLPLLGTALAVLGLIGFRRRRRNEA